MSRHVFAFCLCVCSLSACDAGEPADATPADAAPAEEAADKDAEPAEEPVAAANEDDAGDGCIHGKKHDEGSCEGEQVEVPTGAGHFGAPFALNDAKPLASMMEHQSEEPVLVSGTVDKVCQMKGCWMVIKDGDAMARVIMKDHAFAVPMDGEGKPARVEGVLSTRTFGEKQVKHLAKDGGEDPDKVSGERTETVLTATGVEFLDS